MPLAKVNRGDLITADVINALIDEIEILKQQLGNAGNAPVISLIIPSSNWHVGDPLDIQGENFRFSQGAQLVTFDGVLVTAYKPGTTDSRLLINIPDIPNLPQGGKPVDMIIANGFGSTMRTQVILPVELPLEGDIVDVFWDSISPNPITPPGEANFNYRVRSRAGQTATFTLTPTILTPGWPTDLQVIVDGAVSTNRQVQLAPMQQKPFTVRVPSVPAAFANTSFTIRVVATVGSATGSDTRTFTVGQVVIPPDNTITLAPQSFTVRDSNGFPDPSSGSYNDATGTILCKTGRSGQLEVLVEFTRVPSGASQETYHYSIEPVGTAPSGWTIALAAQTDPDPVIEASDFSGSATKVSRTARISVTTAATGVSANGEFQFKVQRTNPPFESSQTRNFKLALLP